MLSKVVTTSYKICPETCTQTFFYALINMKTPIYFHMYFIVSHEKAFASHAFEPLSSHDHICAQQ